MRRELGLSGKGHIACAILGQRAVRGAIERHIQHSV